MLRLVKSVEERPEHSTVINWTAPVYIKNGEDYYKVCFDIKRKPLPDGTLPLTNEELEEIAKILDIHKIYGVRLIFEHLEYKDYDGCYPEIMNIKAILWLADRFELTSNNRQLENNLINGKLGGRPTIQDKWNAQADKWNQWENLSDEEKKEFKKLLKIRSKK